MEYWKTTHRLRFMNNNNNNNKAALFYCISISIFFSAFTLLSNISTTTTTLPRPCLDIRSQMTSKAHFYIQEFETFIRKMNAGEIIVSKGKRKLVSLSLARTRRFLSGPGSSPPRCTGKCGKCSPCKPVHVPVPPGTPVTAEYYPEAWRCKCGNKLYMP